MHVKIVQARPFLKSKDLILNFFLEWDGIDRAPCFWADRRADNGTPKGSKRQNERIKKKEVGPYPGLKVGNRVGQAMIQSEVGHTVEDDLDRRSAKASVRHKRNTTSKTRGHAKELRVEYQMIPLSLSTACACVLFLTRITKDSFLGFIPRSLFLNSGTPKNPTPPQSLKSSQRIYIF